MRHLALRSTIVTRLEGHKIQQQTRGLPQPFLKGGSNDASACRSWLLKLPEMWPPIPLRIVQ